MNVSIGLLGIAVSFLSLTATADEDYLRYPPKGQVPSGYPSEYAQVIRAAEDEGDLVIYSTTDRNIAHDLIKGFEELYPKIKVEYEDLNSTELHHRFLTESMMGPTKDHGEVADVVWSSAMDLQFSLVSRGYAQEYNSPEIPHLPPWAVWKNQAFGTTYEPVGIVYNKRLLPATDVPQNRDDLVRLLKGKPDLFKRKVVTYDVVKSGVGFLFATQDAGLWPGFWEFAEGLGSLGAHFLLNTETMVKRVATGEDLIAYNVIGSYVVPLAKKESAIGYVFPRDYTLVLSRVMFINKKAKNPNAAKLWVDYLLSKQGQSIIANRARLYSLRSDVEGDATAAALAKALGDSLKPIAIGPNLLEQLTDTKYMEFVTRWRQAVSK
jgi:iron(III) transport system substrate-binding protein